MEKIIIDTRNGKEVTPEDIALELYKGGSKIVYCDIEGICKIGDNWYVLDECGNWDYIPNYYKIIDEKDYYRWTMFELANAVLKWWEEHKYDVDISQEGEEYNRYDEEPEFVSIAKQITEVK